MTEEYTARGHSVRKSDGAARYSVVEAEGSTDPARPWARVPCLRRAHTVTAHTHVWTRERTHHNNTHVRTQSAHTINTHTHVQTWEWTHRNSTHMCRHRSAHTGTTHTHADTGVRTHVGKEGARLRCAQVGSCAVFRMEPAIKVPAVTSAVSPWAPLRSPKKDGSCPLHTRSPKKKRKEGKETIPETVVREGGSREDQLSPSTSGGGRASLPPARLLQTFCVAWNPVRILRARTKGKKKRERQPPGSRPGRRACWTQLCGGSLAGPSLPASARQELWPDTV